jgi:hypothetical protein
MHRLDGFDEELKRLSDVGLLQFRDLCIARGRVNFPGHVRPFDESTIKRHAEPAPELPRVTNRAPDALVRRAQQNLLLDAIGIHGQPAGCSFIPRAS